MRDPSTSLRETIRFGRENCKDYMARKRRARLSKLQRSRLQFARELHLFTHNFKDLQFLLYS